MAFHCLLLRPEPKLAVTLSFLRENGVEISGVALQVVEPSQSACLALNQALKEASEPAQQLEFCLVTSTYAAEELLTLHQQYPLPDTCQVIAVGPATAELLRNAGLNAALPQRHDSEGLLDMTEMTEVKGKRIWLIKGEGGRDLIPRVLHERGAQLQVFDVYRRLQNQQAGNLGRWKNAAPDCIIVTSTEQIDALAAQFEPNWLVQPHWVVVSERQADHLRKLNIKTISVSAGARNKAILRVIKQVMEQQAMSEPSENQTPTVNPSPESVPAVKTSSRGALVLGVFNILLLLGLIAAGVWAWLQWQQFQQAQQQRLQEQTQGLELAQQRQAERQQQQLQQQLQQYQQQADSGLQQMAQLNASTQQKLLEMAGRQPGDWVLAEANYLVRMAGRKLWLEHDANTSVLMLKEADQRLQELEEPGLIPLRDLLARDIQALNQIQTVPVTSIALQLGGLAEQVDNLSLAMVELPASVETEQATQPSGDISQWRENLAAFWGKITKLVTIRERTDMVKPLMSAQQQWLVKEQLRLYVLQARSALVKEQMPVYDQSIQLAVNQLNSHFDLHSNGVQRFIAALSDLARIDINPGYPQQLQSAEPLQRLLEQRLKSEHQEALQ